ncbi:hypothetical protein ACQ4PT_040438 [Festuca glaucescens]
MDGVESYTELLASVAGSGFARVAANDLGTAASVVHSPCVDPVSNGGSHLGQIHSKRTAKSTELPTCRPPSEVGAVEAALRASANKDTAQIFYPKPGTVFDSLAEAYEFYNLFSWEVGFGVRYGRSNINKGNGYKTKQEIECGNASTVLSGGDYLRSKHIRGAFVGDHLKYDVQHCRHIIAPVPSSTGFSCCIWDISARDLLVLDPTMMNSTRKNSGLYTMHYARWYAGLGLARSITDVELGEVREDMFYQLLSMTSNVGDLPGLFWRLK